MWAWSMVAVLCLLAVFFGTQSAFAYPDPAATYPDGLPRTDCVDCHGNDEAALLDPGADPALLASVRKGPHSNFQVATAGCQTCHSVHSATGTTLLPADSVEAVCESCHDGTSGTGVYGVVKACTGLEPTAGHRVGQTNVVPGGDAAGGPSAVAFSGESGMLTCTDCHSPHDAGTVAPFSGDRLRSTPTSDAAYATKTNRLLKALPTGADTPVAEYGAGWCAGCHKGRVGQHAEDSGLMQDHPVMADDTYTYDNVPVVTGVGAITTTLGSLGQSNRGYVMPGPSLGEPTLKSPLQEGQAPLCQQCHEDTRDVGPAERGTNPTLTGPEQEFRVTAYGEDADPLDNPRFQAFPHESATPNLLVRAPEPEEPNSLCLNCHSLVHTATPGSGYVRVFDGMHDDAPGTGDGLEDVPCTTCHVTDLLPTHADKCAACHATPYDTLEPGWESGCQQSGCHPTYHDGPFDTHWKAADTDDCNACHAVNGWWPTTAECLGCHASPASAALPVTASNALPDYEGAALIRFSITKDGKAAIGTTYYRVDGGETLSGKTAVVAAPGVHTLEFWSVDQNGLSEATTQTATFTVAEDVTPPVTTSDAQTTYYWNNARITLTATDASTQGVKATYYSLDGGPAQTGTVVTVPAVDGTVAHTLSFWSEDWSGNVESATTVNFTIVRETATIRLVWGNADVDGQPGPEPDESASWKIWVGSATGTPAYTGSATGEGWTGVNDIVVPLRGTTYYVRVEYEYWEYLGASVGWELIPDQTDFPSVAVTEPGTVIRLSY